ncbi:hypothetical protein [Namhaeicola litoreus]|uniref:Uncharacterized protein n=1 Tax=Namhaeicola litoreus TaxID=1052145 RepID=A0ABW3Y4R6_9FLAO
MKKITLFIGILLLSANLFSQQIDYGNIKFKSKIRNYTKSLPKTNEKGIDREVVNELVKLLGENVLDDKQKKELSNKIWLALSDPEKFDFVYKDYSIKTIENWGVKIKFEDPNFEPNPYLYQWTITEDEYTYFQWAMTRILIYEGLMAYADEAKVASKEIKNLLALKKIKLPYHYSSEYTNSYLERMNKTISNKGLVILIFQNNFDFLACKKENKEQIVNLLDKFQWHFDLP